MREDRGAQARRNSDLRTGSAGSRALERSRRKAVVRDRARGAVRTADAVFIAVGTPSRRGDGHADLSYVYDAAREIAAALDGFTVVITKSTVPVGTGDEVERIIQEARPDADVVVVRTRNFCARGRLSTISSIPIASWSEPMTNAPKRLWPKSIGR